MLIITRKELTTPKGSICFGTEVTYTCIMQDVTHIKTTRDIVQGGYVSATYKRNPYKVNGSITFNATEVKEPVLEY